MKKCPFCAEEIQEEAIRCKHCKTDLFAADTKMEIQNQSEYSSFSRNIGLIGSGLLLMGVFTPIVSAPIVGNITYFNNGNGDGSIVLILAVISGGIVICNRCKQLIYTSLMSIIVILVSFYNVMDKLNEMKSSMNKTLGDNPFRGLADVAMQSVQLQWGWGVLLIGAILCLISGITYKRGIQ